VLRGLTLLPEEVNLFQEDHIKPYLGVGKRPYDPNFRVIAYQFTQPECPYLDKDKCVKYSDRPATCRQFPFSLDPDLEEDILLGVDMNCPVATELVNTSDGLIEFLDRNSAMKLYKLKKYTVENPRRTWVYDLDNNRWIRSDKLV
jgi:Fe-S-cluster containining protein